MDTQNDVKQRRAKPGVALWRWVRRIFRRRLVGRSGNFENAAGYECTCRVLREGIDLPWEDDMLEVEYADNIGTHRGYISRHAFQFFPPNALDELHGRSP